jgi:hypothetical protein
MSLVHNEQTKLLANAFDRASTACFTVGIATPIAGYLYNIVAFSDRLSTSRLAVGLVARLIAAIALHLLARRALKGLKQ